MKQRFALSLLLLAFVTTTFANQINNIVFFGDSLTDNGNLYHLLAHVVPKSPPYYLGRFSNGPTWAELVGQYYAEHNDVRYRIYAVGGSTVLLHAPSSKYFTLVTLDLEVNKYLLDSLFENKSKTLYVIWMGDNDYAFDQNKNPEKSTRKVVAGVAYAMNKLVKHGAKNFLIMNLPDVSRTPDYRQDSSAEKIHSLIVLHNQKLAAMLDAFKKAHANISLITLEFYDVFNLAIDHPEIYNQQYQINITNTADACWQGGLTQSQLSEAQVQTEVQQAISQQTDAENLNIDAQTMGQYIFHNPELAYTFAQGYTPVGGHICSNPDNYLFWDGIHPTKVMHGVIAAMVENALMGHV